MSSFSNWFNGVVTAIKDIPGKILDTLEGWFGDIKSISSDILDGLSGWFADVVTAVNELPGKIMEGILDMLKAVFVPDEEFIDSKVEYLKNSFMELGVATYDMSAIMGDETPLQDITCTIMGQTVTIVRMDLVNEAILKFRAVIRGFITLLLVMYNYDMFMGLIGQQGMQLGRLIQFNRKGKGDN